MVPVSLRDTAVIIVRPGSRQQDRYVDNLAGDAPGQSGRAAVGDTNGYNATASRDRRPKPRAGAGYRRIGRRPLALTMAPGARARAAAPTKCDDLQRAGPAGRCVETARLDALYLLSGACRWRGVEHHL